jgi:hypothetical protein
MIFETIRTIEDSDFQSGIQFQTIHTYTEHTGGQAGPFPARAVNHELPEGYEVVE